MSSVFQSTLSMRRATYLLRRVRNGQRISIHALHEESDSVTFKALYCVDGFQSTLSMRRATTTLMEVPVSVVFQSTLSMRRATKHAAT